MIGRLRLLLGIAAQHVARRRRQTAVATGGVAVGVGFFLAVSAMMIGSQRDFVETLIDSAPHIVVYDELRSPPPQPGVTAYPEAAVQLHGYRVRSEVRGLRNWPLIIATAEQRRGVVASPSLYGAVTLRAGGRQEAIGLIGIDPAIEERVSTLDDRLRIGRLRDLDRVSGGVIVGEDLARRLGLTVGDMVKATSPTGSTRNLRLAGLIKRGQVPVDSSSGYVLLREAQSILGKPFIVNRIGIRVPDPYTADMVARDLERRFTYKSESWQERSADFLSLLVTRNVIMYSVVGAILIVASFGIYTVVSNSVSDKRRDIAILRSIGFSETDLQLIFVFQGFALAIGGIVLGWLLGYGLMEILGALRFPIGGDEEHLPLDRSAGQYLIAATASLLAGTIAAWLPARKAARVDPVDILRGAA